MLPNMTFAVNKSISIIKKIEEMPLKNPLMLYLKNSNRREMRKNEKKSMKKSVFCEISQLILNVLIKIIKKFFKIFRKFQD